MTFELGYTFTGSMGKQIDVSMRSSALRESLAIVDAVEDAAGEELLSFQKKTLMIYMGRNSDSNDRFIFLTRISHLSLIWNGTLL